MMGEFETATIATGETEIFVRTGGRGPGLLLLHGFPETHLMWRDVAPRLMGDFTVVCADLRGYGQSGCPLSTSDHAPYTKRAMANDMVAVMEQLGFPNFFAAGHDRGARVAYRIALDHPNRIKAVAVLDAVPTENIWARADADFALGFWPWSLLAQPSPLPERMLTCVADGIVDNALAHWGSSFAQFPPEVRRAYIATLESAEHAHAICEEYRAAATLDRAHEQADQAGGRRMACPFLALWSARGSLETWFAADGGPLGVWRQWAQAVEGQSVDGGHFFPEEMPEQTAALLRAFFSRAGNAMEADRDK